MALSTGDIVEGTYQLEEKVPIGGNGPFSRWLADDITSYRRKEVVIDILPGDEVSGLHGKSSSPGVRMAGYSSDCMSRYVVWEKEQVPPVFPTYGLPTLTDTTRAAVVRLIEALPETLLAQSLPEYWYYGEDTFLIFYRKVRGTDFHDLSASTVKQQWKQALFGFSSIEPHPKNVPGLSSAPLSSYWPVVLSLIGLLLGVGVYALRSKPQPSSEQTRLTSRLLAFNAAFEQGMAYEKKAAYPEAVQSFETALRNAPVSDAIDARLDSLARAYTEYAQAECVRYRTTASPQLYFIPDQYYHYAALLTRSHIIETCH